MAKRPYFKLGIDALEALYQQNKEDEALLKSLAAELVHRDRPKAKALEQQVLQCLAARNSERLQPIEAPIQPPMTELHTPINPQEHPSRIGVECCKCGTTNFISMREDVTQYLSCAFCKTSYEAIFKYGVLRTKFDTSPEKHASSISTAAWVVLIAIVIIVGFFVAK